MSITNTVNKSTIGIVGWILFIMGILLMSFSLMSFLFYAAFFLASFIIGIILMSRKKFGSGITLLLFTLIIPPIVWTVSFSNKVSKEFENIFPDDASKEIKESGGLDDYSVWGDLEGSDEVSADAKLKEEKIAYTDSILLYGLKAKYYDSLFEGKKPGVVFKLKNNGSKTLKEVEVTVYFKDANGQIIFEEDFYPVLVSDLSFNKDSNKPLKPNYIWSIPKDKFYTVENVPSEWKTGSVSAKITDLEFE